MQISIIDHRDYTKSLSEELKYHDCDVVIADSNIAFLNDKINTESEIFIVNEDSVEDIKQFNTHIRRLAYRYPYIVVLKDTDISVDCAVKINANKATSVNLDIKDCIHILEDYRNLDRLFHSFSDETKDFPSAGGVIAKSAFNQLFLSSLERAERYAERSFLLKITVDNYQDILTLDGAYAADYAVAKLSQELVHLRRQSDIIGQTSKSGFTLLLQRISNDDEPNDAANRFSQSLSQSTQIIPTGLTDIRLKVALLELPSGHLRIEKVVSPVAHGSNN